MWRIRDWSKNFENNRTRELQRMEWVPVPNKHDGDGFRTIMADKRGLEVFAVWILILEVASKCQPRGTLVRDSGEPHTAGSLSRMTGAPERSVEYAIGVLKRSDVAWIEEADADSEDTQAPSQAEIKRAHGRLNKTLAKGLPLRTPLGPVCERPKVCQWCNKEPSPAARGMPGVVAHHAIGYGTYYTDLTVIFVCRSCHGFFESGKLTAYCIMQKFGHEWLRVSDEQGASRSHEGASLSIPFHTPSIPSSLNGESEGKPKRVRAEYPPDFESWWLLYPQKANKADAARAFSKAVARIKLRDGVPDPLEFLADAAREFAKSPTGLGRYCPHPATWLNDAKYDDDRKLWQRGDDDGRRSTGTAGRVGPGQRYTGPDA